MQIRSSLWEDELAQEDEAVGRRGGVDGRETWHGTCNNTTLKMVWWQVVVAASYPAGVLVGTSGLRCLGLATMSVCY